MVSVSPNPFFGSATVTISLESAGFTRLDVFDLSGRIVQTLTEEQMDGGTHNFTLEADDLVPGVYMIKLSSGEQTTTARCVLIR